MGKKLTGKKLSSKRKLWLVVALFVFLATIPLIYFIGKYLDSNPIKEYVQPDFSNDEYNYLIDFETNLYLSNTKSVSKEKFLSGRKSGKIAGFKAYSPSVNIAIPTDDSTLIDGLNVSFWINPSVNNINATLVFSVLDQNKNQIHWDGYSIKKQDLIADNWQCLKHKFDFPSELICTSNSIKIYLWNQDENGSVLYIDDLEIGFNENFVAESPRSKIIDFEDGKGKNISSKYSLSGFYSTFASGIDGFSGALKIPMNELKYENLSSVSYSFHFLCEKPNVDAAFVFSIVDSSGNDILWQSTHLSFESHETEVWEIGNGNAKIPEEAISPTNTIKIYLWNRNDNTIYIDDVYIVIREKGASTEDVSPACNLINSSEFEKKTNQPPYEFVNMTNKSLKGIKDSKIHSVFTKSKKVLVGNFNQQNDKDEILSIYANETAIISFGDDCIEYTNVDFNPVIEDNFVAFSDDEFVFIGNEANNTLVQYQFIDGKFESVGQIESVNVTKIIGVSFNIDETISVFETNGKVKTYSTSKSYSTLISDQILVNSEYGNIKCIKGDFFDNSEQIVLIYMIGSQDFYKVYDYSTINQSWDLSALHSNKSSQSLDKLKFNDAYYLCRYNLDSSSELLKMSFSPKFDLKIFNFNKISYEILHSVEFVDFPSNQNPKYYEVSKIICGNFVGDERSELIVFQDNLNRVDWLPQKVEMYCFK